MQPGVISRALHTSTQSHGLTIPTGTISTVGVAGLTLGGGEGWFSGSYGLTCDNMVAADGSRFQAKIAPFGLATPGALN